MSANDRPVAVVTGASSGIGESTARLLAAKGWHCVIIARRRDRLEALAGELGCEWEVCDVGDRAAVEATATRILERHPTLHLLVNNAGIPARRRLDEVELELVEQVARVNYLGGVWATRALLPGLRSGAGLGGAHVVNVVSVAGAVAFAPSGAYSAAKHAQLAFSRSLRVSLLGSGIAVHTIVPGYVQTEGFPQRSLLAHPLLRRIVAKPEDVARAILKAVERGRREVVVPWFPYRPGARPLRRRATTVRPPGRPDRAKEQGVPCESRRRRRRRSGMTELADGRVAVVTGASSGIGEATARRLAERGWHCVLVARREDALRQLAGEIGGEAAACDVADRAAVARLTAEILERHPSIGLLVNCAGILARGTFLDAPLDLVERALAVNYLGGVWVTRGLLDGLRRTTATGEKAHIVTIASIGGSIVFTPAASYSASKHAQVAFSRSLRAALSGSGIEVHTIMPGFVTTPGFPHPTFFATRLGRRFVVGPDDVARRILSVIDRGRAESVIPWFPYGLGPMAQALMPSLTARVLGGADYPDHPDHPADADGEGDSAI